MRRIRCVCVFLLIVGVLVFLYGCSISRGAINETTTVLRHRVPKPNNSVSVELSQYDDNQNATSAIQRAIDAGAPSVVIPFVAVSYTHLTLPTN